MRKEAPTMVRFLDKFIAKNMFEDTGSDFLSLDPEGRFNLLTELSEGFEIPLSLVDRVHLSVIPERENFQLFIKEAYQIAIDPDNPSSVLQDFLHQFPDLHLPTRQS